MSEKKRIVKVRKNDDGDITNVMLEDGTVYTIEEAIKNGQIQGVDVVRSKSGSEYIRSLPDGNPDNNLDNLPTF